MSSSESEDDETALRNLIEDYFYKGFKYREIVAMLAAEHDICMTLSKLEKRLRIWRLQRRKGYSPLDTIRSCIQRELRGSGRLLGYRSMHKKLVEKYQLKTTWNEVRQLLRVLDPEGVEMRKKRRLKRRVYRARGPNFLWHIDGYDKLKPYGFAIHGCIDGYSRRMMWLKVSSTNQNSNVVANYYLETVNEVQGVPHILRMDPGTENVLAAQIQIFLREDHDDDHAGQRSVICGKSTGNQRIESWWAMLRKWCTSWWMDFFHDLVEADIYENGNLLHKQAMQFCFTRIIQQELDNVLSNWNSHSIRHVRHSTCPAGRPDFNYHVPEFSDTQDFKHKIQADINEVRNALTMPEDIDLTLGCTMEFAITALELMEGNGKVMPETYVEALNLFLYLIDNINE